MVPTRDGEISPAGAGPGTGRLLVAAKRLVASWQRSEEYGVSADTVDPLWAGTVQADSLYFSCGQEVLTALHRTLADEPISLMLTDADGLLLNRLSGDPDLLRSLDRVHLAPGFTYSERDAGTNGMGLALADRAPALVRAEDHYSASLRTYTCAAVPVFDPVSGALEGSVNITTWSRSSPELLLALAQSAAGNTAALMLARSLGRSQRPGRKGGGVFRLQRGGLEPAAGTLRTMSAAWTAALDAATRALAAGRVVAAVGEHGAGRVTLLAQALRQARPGTRILSAAAPAPEDVDAWLSLWTPELAKPDTAVVVENADLLPAWAAQELQDHVTRALRAVPPPTDGSGSLAWAVTAAELEAVPHPLAASIDTVITVPALRDRGDDVLHLARYAARQTRLREIDFTPAAETALLAHDWPDNVDELFTVVHDAAVRAETIDIQHLPAYLLGGPGVHLSRIESMERDEIVRSLARPGVTVAAAAAELGISRATIYRRIARLGIRVPR